MSAVHRFRKLILPDTVIGQLPESSLLPYNRVHLQAIGSDVLIMKIFLQSTWSDYPTTGFLFRYSPQLFGH